MDIPRVEKDRTRCEEAVCGSKGRFGVEVGTGAWSSRAAHDDGTRGPTLKRAARPFVLISSFFFPFRSLDPLRPLCSFTHILLSGTPIDAPFSPTRSTSKHLPIPTIYFSFKRSKCADMVILFFVPFGLFLMIQDSD
jgi:hypothetical protein